MNTAHDPATGAFARHALAATTPGQLLDVIEADLGGRSKVTALLSADPQSQSRLPEDKFAQLFQLLADPHTADESFSSLCRSCKVSLGEVFDAIKRGQFVRPYLQALQHAADAYLPLVDDMLMRVLPHDLPCPACKGTAVGTAVTPDAIPPLCSVCRGTGVQTCQPEFERQKHALTFNPLAPKAGPGIAITNDNRSISVPAAEFAPNDLHKLMAATDQVLYRRRVRPPAAPPEVVEAEPLDTAAPPE